MLTDSIATGNPDPTSRNITTPAPKRREAPIAPPRATERKLINMAASVARLMGFVKLATVIKRRALIAHTDYLVVALRAPPRATYVNVI